MTIAYFYDISGLYGKPIIRSVSVAHLDGKFGGFKPLPKFQNPLQKHSGRYAIALFLLCVCGSIHAFWHIIGFIVRRCVCVCVTHSKETLRGKNHPKMSFLFVNSDSSEKSENFKLGRSEEKYKRELMYKNTRIVSAPGHRHFGSPRFWKSWSGNEELF